MGRTWAAVVAAGIVLAVHATAAGAAPRPLAPADGARVTSSFPVFRWSLPSGESALAIAVASAPLTGADGAFPEPNVVAAATLAADAERWTPARPLWAGAYWWLVTSADERGTPTQSDVSSFTIPISLKVVRLSGPAKRVLTVRWLGNVRKVSILVRMAVRGRLVWKAVVRATSPAPGRPVATRFRIPTRYALDGASFTVRISARLAPARN